MKRLFDICLAILILALSWPFFIMAAVGILLTSRGPMFYKALRVGQGEVPFTMLKFRSMHVNDGSGPEVTAVNDPRIFGFGKFLRATKIDELPQLLNVLKGEMSFVGPRPESPALVAKFYKPWMFETLDVRPGITSPGTLDYAQNSQATLKVGSAEEDYGGAVLERKLKLDLEYVRSHTILGDIRIILRTAFIVLKKVITLSNSE